MEPGARSMGYGGRSWEHGGRSWEQKITGEEMKPSHLSVLSTKISESQFRSYLFRNGILVHHIIYSLRPYKAL